MISSFSGVPGPGNFHDFGESPACAGIILKQISAQLRKANIVPRGCQARGTLLVLAAPQVMIFGNLCNGKQEE